MNRLKSIFMSVCCGLGLMLTTPMIMAQTSTTTVNRVFVWTDASGNKHYGDAEASPPASAKERYISITTPVVAAVPVGSATAKPSDFPQKTIANKSSCEAAMQSLALLSNPQKGASHHGPGNTLADPVRLNPKEQADALAQAKARVKVYCIVPSDTDTSAGRQPDQPST